MPNLTVSIPAEIAEDLTKILQMELAGEDGDSKLTGNALFKKWIASVINPKLKAYRIRTGTAALVVAEKAAREEKEAVYAIEKAARIAAEQTISDDIDVSIAKI